MLPIDRITIWENRARQRLLTSFRDAVVAYFASKEDRKERRTQINRLATPVYQAVRAANVDTRMVHRGPLTHGGRITVLEVISNVFHLQEFQASPQAAVDIVDMAIGAYAHDEWNAKLRSINPLYYLSRLFNRIIEIPFEAAGRLGVDRAKLESSLAGKIGKGIAASVLWILTVLYFADQLKLLDPLLKLIGVQRP